jgi:hypothetical protein
MIGRTLKILSRFPAHFEATRPGKQLEAVGDALAINLDEQSAIMARIRRSHRVGDADELRDLLLIGALHGITQAELALLFTRFERAATLLLTLTKAATPAARDAAAEELCRLWGIAAPAPRLPLFAPAHANNVLPDLEAAKTRLIQNAQAATVNDVLLDATRTRIKTISRIHASGNGTIRALLEGAANALDLDILQVFHSKDRFWHAATVRDRLVLSCPGIEPASGNQPAREVMEPLAAATELMGIEENPLERVSTDQVGRHHTELFSVLRRGFERALLQVRFTGKETKTIGPMVVNRDEGHGVGYAGTIPPGSVVVFTEEGRVTLDGSDVTSFAFSWKGGCFAGSDKRATDFVFDGAGVNDERRAHFAVTTPAGAFDPEFLFPHSGEDLPMPGVDVGETRFAFFIQEAHFSKLESGEEIEHVEPVEETERVESAEETAHVLRVAPRTAVGFLDNSVFAAAANETAPDSAIVSLSWLEHRAFCVRLLIPRRFHGLTPDDSDGVQTRQRVAQAVKRFQPAGVEVRVEFEDDRWVMGEGTLNAGDLIDPIVQLRSGTMLWSAPV